MTEIFQGALAAAAILVVACFLLLGVDNAVETCVANSNQSYETCFQSLN